jgi:hypothetical protein
MVAANDIPARRARKRAPGRLDIPNVLKALVSRGSPRQKRLPRIFRTASLEPVEWQIAVITAYCTKIGDEEENRDDRDWDQRKKLETLAGDM